MYVSLSGVFSSSFFPLVFAMRHSVCVAMSQRFGLVDDDQGGDARISKASKRNGR
jgi:hypothetical protein